MGSCHSECLVLAMSSFFSSLVRRLAGMCFVQVGRLEWCGFFFFFWVKGGLSTLRQMMKVPNEPGLSPNNGLKNAFLSDQSMASKPRKGQAKRFGAKTTSPDGQAGHVMTHVRHRARHEQRQV